MGSKFTVEFYLKTSYHPGPMTLADKSLFTFAHISDLHFAKLSLNPIQFFSKQWLGNANVLLTRKRAFDPDSLTTLFPLFAEKQVDSVFITGDLSSTSQPSEFAQARELVNSLKSENLRVFAIPGNHDHYTKRAYESRLFYDFFPARYDTACPYSLKEEGVTLFYLGKEWWLCLLDTALATSLISSRGLFSEKTEAALEAALKSIPAGQNVIMLNHFSLFTNESTRKELVRKEALKNILSQFPQVKLFLHGHTHRHAIADLRASQLPIVLDSGSTAYKHAGTCNFIHIGKQGCLVEAFKNTLHPTEGYGEWECFATAHFAWKSL